MSWQRSQPQMNDIHAGNYKYILAHTTAVAIEIAIIYVIMQVVIILQGEYWARHIIMESQFKMLLLANGKCMVKMHGNVLMKYQNSRRQWKTETSIFKI